MDAERWRRIKDVFSTVLAMSPDLREGWLAEATSDDPTLIDEVRGLLAAYEAAGDRFEEGAAAAVPELQLRTTAAGLRVGAYRILSELGRGGMGAVYLAVRDDEAFPLKVALKLIKRGMDTDQIVRRFLYERRILAGLSHPNIARLYDGGTTTDGRPYFVMEYVEGRPIRQFADEERLDLEARLRLILKVCSAVQFAHQNLIVHRDLKPANILVGADGEPKLLDFGIAKLLDFSSASPSSALTEPDHRPMTPDYASPEQVSGGAVTTATDVYGLGILLYELLVGMTPAAVVRRLGSGWADRPASQAARAVSGERPWSRQLAGDLDTIIGKAMEREPLRRYGTAAALAEDLERHLDRRPVLARRPTVAYRLGRAVLRHKLASAFALSVALLTGALAYQTQALARQNQQTQQQKERAENLVRFLTDLFRVADPEESRGKDVPARDILDASERRLLSQGVQGAGGGAAAPPLEPALQSEFLRTMGVVRTHLGLYDEAQATLTRALELRSGETGPDAELDRADTLSKLGMLASERADYAGSRRFYESALASKRRLRPADDLSLAEDLNGLGLAATEAGELEKAAAFLAEAEGISRRAGDGGRESLAVSWNNLGNLSHAKEDYAEAERYFRQALALDQEALGKDHPESVRVQNNLAMTLRLQGDPRAEALYQDLLSIQRRLLGPAHHHLALTLGNLAVAQLDQGHTDAAEASLHESQAIRRKLRLPPDLDEANTLNTLASIQYGKGDLRAAEASYQESLDLFRRLNGPPTDLNNALRGLALVRQGRSDTSGAEGLVRESLALLAGVANAEKDSADSWYFLAELQRTLRRPGEAEASYRQALELHRKVLGPGHADVARDQIRLGSLLLDAGRAAEAEPLLAQGLEIRRKVSPPAPGRTAFAEGLLGQCYLLLGRPERARPLLESSYQTFLRLHGRDHADTRAAAGRLHQLAQLPPSR